MWLDANELQTNINDKYEKKKIDTLNHDHKGLGVDRDFSSTTNPQELHNRKSRPPKIEKKKNRERERNNILCVRKLCTEGERALEIYSKKMRIRTAKNKGR